MTALLAVSLVSPLLVAGLLALGGPATRLGFTLAPWAALPAVALALLSPRDLQVDVPWLLLGARLGVDAAGGVFLLFTSLLWWTAALYARSYLEHDPRSARFTGFYMLCMAGNFGLIVCFDLATFLLFFTVMTFAGYGLVIHTGTAEASRAGLIYLILAVVGEAMLLAGGLIAAAGAPSLHMADVSASLAASPLRAAAMALLFFGFGVKAGVLPVHVWLPLAHPVAPTPASAVLSGSMIKAGLLGWLRFLPLGEGAFTTAGGWVITLGLATAFYGVVIGVMQREAKTVLAYSSISQMGVMTAVLGIALSAPDAAPLALTALVVYAAHHGLVKGALFLGVGVSDAVEGTTAARRWTALGLGFGALAMAGAPLTSGSLAKAYVKQVAYMAPQPWEARLDTLLGVSAVGTALLMANYLALTLRLSSAPAHGRLKPEMWGTWALLLGFAATVLWFFPPEPPLTVRPGFPPDLQAMWGSAWPVVVGGLIFATALLAIRRTGFPVKLAMVPAGDVLVPLERALAPLARRLRRPEESPPPDPIAWLGKNWYAVYAHRSTWAPLFRVENRLTHWPTAGLALLIVGLLLLGALYRGSG
jgi:formate hydrogenlyase subunit 3/multisubunit Na+/H+ antiporter MnhD subunit